MNRLRRLHVAAALAVLALSAVAAPCTAQTDRWSVDGFGTVGATYHDTDGIEFRRTVVQGRGARAGEIDLGTDSLFGLQSRFAPSHEVSVVAQGIARRDSEGKWRPDLERAYVSFSAGGSLLARAGRIGFDSYLLAESPSVGYSYLPIRPAPEFFGLFVGDSIDGADIAFSTSFVGGVARFRVLAGHGPGSEVFDWGREDVGSDQFVGLIDYTHDAWLVRVGASYVRPDNPGDFAAFADALRATGVPDSIALAERLDNSGRKILGWSFGMAYDGRPLQWQLLLTRIDTDMISAPKLNSGVTLVGYRYRQFTPYLAFARVRSFATIYPTGLPNVPELAPLDAAARTLQTSAQANQRTASLGMKYDITPHLDLKAQIDRVRLRGSTLVLDRSEQHISDNAQMTVLGLALDFVF